jgi:hypothetical protein
LYATAGKIFRTRIPIPNQAMKAKPKKKERKFETLQHKHYTDKRSVPERRTRERKTLPLKKKLIVKIVSFQLLQMPRISGSQHTFFIMRYGMFALFFFCFSL